MCNCERYLTLTENTLRTKIGYFKVFICINCKKYYIKHFGRFKEVQYNHTENKWQAI